MLDASKLRSRRGRFGFNLLFKFLDRPFMRPYDPRHSRLRCLRLPPWTVLKLLPDEQLWGLPVKQ